MKNNKPIYNLLALFTIFIWGTTFISTKILLDVFSPIEIMVLRFVIAYIVLWIMYPKTHKIMSFKDEIIMFFAGITGGTIYFITENTALNITQASNVGLILATAPILTAIVAHLFTKEEKLHKKLVIGFFVAISGVFLIMFNGNFILKLNPLGDILALCAAISWALYSILVKKLGNKYNYIYLTRKIFLYALITMIPFAITSNFKIELMQLTNITSIIHLLFLGVIASGICFITWNYVVDKIGAIKANNFIYCMPIITVVFSYIILKEKITIYSLIGSILILLGVYVSEK